jgi:hypothetical protein
VYTHYDNLKLQTDMQVVQSARKDMQPDSEATQKNLNVLDRNAYSNAMLLIRSATKYKTLAV